MVFVRTAIGALAACLIGAAAVAQPSAPSASGVTESDSRTVYDAAYIAGLNAITAEDILERIPGIQDLLTEAQATATQRGFGSTGTQILFNGRRLSSKNITVASALARIQASQVKAVELIRGSLPGLDVRAEGTIVNLVLTEDLVTGSGNWEARLSHYSVADFKFGGKLAYAGGIGALTYAVSVEATPRYDGRDRFNLFYPITRPPLRIPDAAPFLRQDEILMNEATDHVAAGSLSYEFAGGDVLNLNGRFADQGQAEQLPSDNYSLVTGADVFTRLTNNIRDVDTINWEVSGDYEHFFSASNSLKVIAIYADTSQNDEREFFVRPAGGVLAKTRIQLQYPDRTERILRGTYRGTISETQSFEIGAEGAQNILDTRIQLLTIANGVTTDVPLFNPSAKVKELRGETFATYSWRATSALSLDAAIDTESSRLTQRGRDANARRAFFYVKPRLDVRYTLAPGSQIKAKIQRTVSQLNFADFVAGFNTEASRLEVLRAGNPNLVPEKQWLYELQYEYRLPKDQGVVTLRGYYGDVSDKIENIPVGATILASTGNIGAAHFEGVEVKLGLRLGWLGLPNATLDASAYRQRSKAADPFTGERRIFARLPRGNWTASVRQDTAWRGLSYGVSVTNRDSDFFIDPNTILDYNPRRYGSIFAELKVSGDLTLRFDGMRLGASGARGERFYWDGHRGLTSLNRVELIKSHIPQELRLTLRGTF
jgi:outer membrane receptor for ferrienterochelin and colicin